MCTRIKEEEPELRCIVLIKMFRLPSPPNIFPLILLIFLVSLIFIIISIKSDTIQIMEGAMHPKMMNITKTSDGNKATMMMMSPMTFYWGKSSDLFISGWPGDSSRMYIIALIFIFSVSILVEFLSHARLIKPGLNHVVAGLLQTVLYFIRAGFAFLVMLAVMSFNVGVLLAAMAGYTIGFLLFGSKVFKKPENVTMSAYDYHQKLPSDLPPLNC